MWTFSRRDYVRKAVKRGKVVTTNTYKRLLNSSKKQSGVMHVDLLKGITTFKKKIPQGQVAAAVADKDFSKIDRMIPWDNLSDDLSAAMESIGNTLGIAGLISLDTLPPNVSDKLRWDITNPTIREYIKQRTGSLITGIQDDTREVIQNFVARSFTETMSPRDIARNIKGSIGLYPAQERALANYRRGLMSQGVGGARLETYTDNYEDKLLNYRAMSIARTETRGATNHGQLSVWREGARQSLFDGSRAERVWVAEGPEPCDDCLSMDGAVTGLDEPWVMPDATQVDCPPWDVHPHCYCGMELQFNVFGGEREEEDNEEDTG